MDVAVDPPLLLQILAVHIWLATLDSTDLHRLLSLTVPSPCVPYL